MLAACQPILLPSLALSILLFRLVSSSNLTVTHHPSHPPSLFRISVYLVGGSPRGPSCEIVVESLHDACESLKRNLNKVIFWKYKKKCLEFFFLFLFSRNIFLRESFYRDSIAIHIRVYTRVYFFDREWFHI